MIPITKKANGGAPFRPSARVWNQFLELSNRQENEQVGEPSGGYSESVIYPCDTVLIRNDTGSTLEPGQIVTPSGGLGTFPTKPLDARRRPVMSVTAPASDGDPVVIVHTAIKDDLIGQGVAGGVTICTVDIEDATHEYASPIPGSVAKLQSGNVGSVRILAKESAGTGDKLCLVDVLGDLMPGGAGILVESAPLEITGGTISFPSTTSATYLLATAYINLTQYENAIYEIIANATVRGTIGGKKYLPLCNDGSRAEAYLRVTAEEFTSGSGSGGVWAEASRLIWSAESAYIGPQLDTNTYADLTGWDGATPAPSAIWPVSVALNVPIGLMEGSCETTCIFNYDVGGGSASPAAPEVGVFTSNKATMVKVYLDVGVNITGASGTLTLSIEPGSATAPTLRIKQYRNSAPISEP